jgi:hypothetical protein
VIPTQRKWLFLVRLLMDAAFFAPKGSKKPLLGDFSDEVQLDL